TRPRPRATKMAAAIKASAASCRNLPKPRSLSASGRKPKAIARKTRPMTNLAVLTMCIGSSSQPVIPAKAGIQTDASTWPDLRLDPSLRWGDGVGEPSPRRLLTGQAFVIIGALQLDLAQVRRVVGLDAAGEARALHGLGAEIIEAFDAELPGAVVEHQQVPFVDVGRDEQVQRGGLVDIGRAVGGELDPPSLVVLEAGLEDILLLLGQEVEMLDRAAPLEDGRPDA